MDAETLAAARSGDNLARARRRMAAEGLAALVVPREDEHMGEYVPPCSERLRWLTGFGGSAGTAVVLPGAAALLVDGRYLLEAPSAAPAFETRHAPRATLRGLLEEHRGALAEAAAGGGPPEVGFDPRHFTPRRAAALRAAAKAAGALARALDANPVDAEWSGRPPPPSGPARAHPPELAGRSSEDKRREAGEAVARAGADAVLLTLPDSVAWLLNARGSDLPCVPVPLSFAALAADGSAVWFIDPARVEPGLAEALREGPPVEARPPAALAEWIAGMRGRRLMLDPDSAPESARLAAEAAGAEVVFARDPCLLPKARKNAVELACIRRAHLSDAAALARFLARLPGAVRAGGVDEAGAAEMLEGFRRERPDYLGPSFETISSSGPNAALNHYRVSPETSRPLSTDEVYLVDSGGQYPGGTTDVTRTLFFGDEPPAELRRRFTQVLRGHIALASARLPAGSGGDRLDPLARQFLWRDGVDYDHGTGHGVGSQLSVHEGPQRVARGGAEPLLPGMVVSNEPGFYVEGEYGIRIENLVAAREVEGGGGWLEFENLTLAPVQRSLVDAAAMAPEEREFLDRYHARVMAEVGPLLPEGDREWLAGATRPLLGALSGRPLSRARGGATRSAPPPICPPLFIRRGRGRGLRRARLDPAPGDDGDEGGAHREVEGPRARRVAQKGAHPRAEGRPEHEAGKDDRHGEQRDEDALGGRQRRVARAVQGEQRRYHRPRLRVGELEEGRAPEAEGYRHEERPLVGAGVGRVGGRDPPREPEQEGREDDLEGEVRPLRRRVGGGEEGALQGDEQRVADEHARDLRRRAAESDPRAGDEQDDVVGAGRDGADEEQQRDGRDLEARGRGGDGGGEVEHAGGGAGRR